MNSKKSARDRTPEREPSNEPAWELDGAQGGKNAKDRHASTLSITETRSPEERRDALKQYLQLPERNYDYFVGLIEFYRPGLMEIHQFVKAVAFDEEPDNDFILTLAMALAQFLTIKTLNAQKADFVRHLRIDCRAGRKAPAQGEPIKEIQAAKFVMDLLDSPDRKLSRTEAIERACELLYRDADFTKQRTIERWYDTHRDWVKYVYDWRDSLRKRRPVTKFEQESLERAEDYITRLEKGLRDQIKRGAAASSE